MSGGVCKHVLHVRHARIYGVKIMLFLSNPLFFVLCVPSCVHSQCSYSLEIQNDTHDSTKISKFVNDLVRTCGGHVNFVQWSHMQFSLLEHARWDQNDSHHLLYRSSKICLLMGHIPGDRPYRIIYHSGGKWYHVSLLTHHAHVQDHRHRSMAWVRKLALVNRVNSRGVT